MQTVIFKSLRDGALALGLLAAAALLPQAADAGSLQDRGDFGGTWTPIAPSDHHHWRYAERYHYSEPVFVAPDYAYGPGYYEPESDGPPLYYGDGPGIALVAPGVGISLGID